jgi:hypothetical protein
MEAPKSASHVKYLRAMRMSINPNSGLPRLSLKAFLKMVLPREWGGLRGIDILVANRGKYGDFGDDMGKLPSKVLGKKEKQ